VLTTTPRQLLLRNRYSPAPQRNMRWSSSRQVFQASFDVVASFLVGIDEVMDNVLLDLG